MNILGTLTVLTITIGLVLALILVPFCVSMRLLTKVTLRRHNDCSN